jgi:predicted amidophosphoribosyltransferase
VRVAEGRSQTELTPAERRENVRGVFAPARGEDARLEGADNLLIDDVLTTGATAGEAASALGRMGARSVTLLAFARALPSTPRRPA